MFEIQEGRKPRPFIVLIYATPGTGKSEFASNCFNPLFFDMENGTDFLDVKRVKVSDFETLRQGLYWFKEQTFETLVIDSLSAVEKMALQKTFLDLNVDSLQHKSLKFGEGHLYFRALVQKIVTGSEWLRDNGKNVIIIAHSKVKSVNDPTVDTYDRVEFDINKELVNSVAAACDGVFFLRPQIRVLEHNDEKRASSSGSRELIMSDKGSALSKSRFNIGTSYEFPFENDTEKRSQMYRDFWLKLKGV